MSFCVDAEYGGKWKMLHYFARKFFHGTIMSAYLEHDNISLYYISDAAQQTTQVDVGRTGRRQFVGSETEQLSPVPNSTKSRSVNSQNVAEELSVSQHQTSLGNEVGESGLVDGDATREDFKHSARQLRDCTVVLHCFRWYSFEPAAKWNITFSQVSCCCWLQGREREA